MATLRRTSNPMAQHYYRDTNFVRGQFTGANGSVGTILFKGLGAIARTGEGVYTFTLLQADGVTALKGFHIKNLNFAFVAPNSADGGSGLTEITTDSMNATGVLTFTTRNLAGTAADVIGLCKMGIELSPEAAS